MKNYELEPSWESLDVFIVSSLETQGTISVPGMNWSESFTVVPGTTTQVTIPNDIAEVYSNQVIEGKGVFVDADQPVSVYCINFNGYTADGTRVLPIQAVGEHYRVSAYQGLPGYNYNSELLVVATQDNTMIEIELSTGSMNGESAGTIIPVTLQQGECYQLLAGSADGDLTGTRIDQVNPDNMHRPFAVFSGASCANIPAECFACDHIVEQNYPVDSWGQNFQLVPFSFASRYGWRILADEDDTEVSANGATPVYLNAGEYLTYAGVTEPVCVTSNKPTCLTQLMEGVSCAGQGDPSLLMIADAGQKVQSFEFSTVVSAVITSHNLNIVIDTEDNEFLILDGTALDPSIFTPFESCPELSYTSLSVIQGFHSVESTGGDGFIAYAYGTGAAESYAFSAASTVIFHGGATGSGSEPEAEGLYLYPNPVVDELIAGIPAHLIGDDLEILDATGKQVWFSAANTASTIRIDLRGFASGNYFLRIGTVRKSFVIR